MIDLFAELAGRASASVGAHLPARPALTMRIGGATASHPGRPTLPRPAAALPLDPAPPIQPEALQETLVGLWTELAWRRCRPGDWEATHDPRDHPARSAGASLACTCGNRRCRSASTTRAPSASTRCGSGPSRSAGRPARRRGHRRGSGSLGRLGRPRPGFQRLVSRVGLGEVGLVLMLEASRLARSNSEWHRLIELCGLAGALIADEGAVYDPRDPNDRLLLGVKGHSRRPSCSPCACACTRARWNKARKGCSRSPCPVGYVGVPDGGWELDPDAQVRERLAYLFATFRRVGVARAVVRELNGPGLTLPTR